MIHLKHFEMLSITEQIPYGLVNITAKVETLFQYQPTFSLEFPPGKSHHLESSSC